MKSLVFIAILAAACAQDYHDGVFHFSTLKSAGRGSRLTSRPVYTQQVLTSRPVYTQQVVAARPVYKQQVFAARPVYTQQLIESRPAVYAQHVYQAAPVAYAQAEPVIRILEHIQETDPSGPYRTKFSTENGIKSSEQGVLTGSGPEGPAVAKEGSYSYVGDDGQTYSLNWIADEYGFRASGAHLPTPPPIPAEIQRSLELIASQPQQKYSKK